MYLSWEVWHVRKLLVLLVLASLFVLLAAGNLACTSQQANSDADGAPVAESDLIGTWQNTPMVSSGMTDIYHFSDTGRFIYEYSQYDSDRSVLAESGTWSVSNNVLTLGVDTKEVFQNGEIVTYLYEYPEVSEFEVTKPVADPEANKRLAMTIGEERFWRLSENPGDYLNSSLQ